MVRRVAFHQLLRALLSLLLVGLFLGGSTASYCLAKQERNGYAACSKKADRIEQFTKSAPDADALIHVHSLKFQVFVHFLLRQPVLLPQKEPAKAFGYPVFRGTYLAILLVHFIVKNAP
jgi:hypothetical protein